MTRQACERSPEVLRGRRDDLSVELRDHVATCDDCRRALTLAAVLRDAPVASSAPTSTSAGLLWWKSRLSRRARAEAEALQPVVVAETVAPPVVLIGLGLWLVWESASWSQWLRPFVGDAASTVIATAAVLAFVGAGAVLLARVGSALRDRHSTGAG